MLVIRVQSDSDATPHPIREGTVTLVGRSFDCDVILSHESVSRRHARIVVDNGRATIVTLNNGNPVYRNGQPVTETSLAAGDHLRFGKIEAVVEEAPDPEPAKGGPTEGAPGLTLDQATYLRVDALVQGAINVDGKRVIRLLSEIARSLGASLSLNTMLERVVTLLVGHIPAERAMLLMRASDSDEFVPRVTRFKASAPPVSSFSVSRTVMDLVARERASVLTADVRQDNRFGAAVSLVRDDVRSLMCAPLVADGSVIGLLYVDNSWHSQFSVADLELFTALADYASVAVAQARLAEKAKQEARRRERLARYHSPAVVERVLRDDPSTEEGATQERDVTILFADIVKFTTMSETMPAEQVVRILNAFFSKMTEIVFAHEGTVDKFIGDAILVMFGAPIAQADHARRAIDTAKAMQAALEELNARQVAPLPLQIRVALHSGLAIAGDIGSQQRLEYTVIGDVVNTAARLQSEVAAPGDIILSRATLERCGMAFPVEAIGPVNLRGRAATIEAFRLARR
jgi:adenylate cyclase